MNKSKSREAAMKMLFALSLGGDYAAEAIIDDLPLSAKESAFCNLLVEGVKANVEDLKKVISEYSQAWSLERIGKVELCILLIATYEIIYLPEVPVGASINEAVELAKEYCDEKSPAFINGILGSIGRKYRA